MSAVVKTGNAKTEAASAPRRSGHRWAPQPAPRPSSHSHPARLGLCVSSGPRGMCRGKAGVSGSIQELSLTFLGEGVNNPPAWAGSTLCGSPGGCCSSLTRPEVAEGGKAVPAGGGPGTNGTNRRRKEKGDPKKPGGRAGEEKGDSTQRGGKRKTGGEGRGGARGKTRGGAKGGGWGRRSRRSQEERVGGAEKGRSQEGAGPGERPPRPGPPPGRVLLARVGPR